MSNIYLKVTIEKKSPCIWLNKNININFNKNETESKMENPKHSQRDEPSASAHLRIAN